MTSKRNVAATFSAAWDQFGRQLKAQSIITFLRTGTGTGTRL